MFEKRIREMNLIDSDFCVEDCSVGNSCLSWLPNACNDEIGTAIWHMQEYWMV